jgi:hypothetical protein
MRREQFGTIQQNSEEAVGVTITGIRRKSNKTTGIIELDRSHQL